MATFVLVRHAQASFGSREYDALSPLGVSRADATGGYFAARGLRFDRIVIGPRSRHAQTAQRLAAACPEERSQDAALDRWGRGDHDEPGWETREAFGRRVSGWFDAACAAVAAGERVLVVTFAGVVALLVSEVLHAPPSGWGQLLRTMRNASMHLAPDLVSGI